MTVTKMDKQPWIKKEKDQALSPLGVPILRFGRNNNFGEIKEILIAKMLAKHGDAARFLKLMKHYVPLVPTEKELLERGRDVKDHADLIKDAQLNSERELCKLQLKYGAMYADLLEVLSKDSLSQIKLRDEWKSIDEGSDCLNLWKLIQDVHELGGVTGDTILDKMAAKREYEKLKMGEYEDLANFKARYDRAVSNWITFKNTVMTDAELAWGFFERLNDCI